MNIDHLSAVAVLSVINALYRGKTPPDRYALLNWLKDEGAVMTAAFIEAMPDSVYRQTFQSLRRLKSVVKKGAASQ